MRHVSQLKEVVATWRNLEKSVTDLEVLVDLSVDEDDRSLEEEIPVEIEKIERSLEELEFELHLGGEYDRRGTMLAVHAGAGGTESQDWAQMLLRMYLRWAEKSGYQTEVIELSPGEETGIKSVLIEVKGDYAYGYLKGERGGAPIGPYLTFRRFPQPSHLLRPGGDYACRREQRGHQHRAR